jgi:hypothetical protein
MLKLIRYGLILLAGVALSGCIGNNDSEKAHIRLLNVSQDYNSLDAYTDDDRQITAVSTGATSDYANVKGDTYTVGFATANSSTKLKTFSEKLEKKSYHTYVAFGRKGAFNTLEISENQGEPDSGNTNLLVLNAGTDAGAVDVYLTGSTENLSDVSPVASNLAVGTASGSGYVKMTSGNYRLRVTGTGNTDDLRLDIDNVTLDSGKVAALVVSDTAGGVLMNAVYIPQQKGMNFLTNTKSRLRAVNGYATTANVTANAAAVASGLRSANLGNYQLVDAGPSVAVQVAVNGSTVHSSTESLTAGYDYTYLLYNNGTDTALLLTDDNRPSTSTTKYKLRLVNALSSTTESLVLDVASDSVVSDGVAQGTASAYQEVTANSSNVDVDVYSTVNNYHTYNTTYTFTAQSVYTLFVFGDATTTGSSAKIKQDRIP